MLTIVIARYNEPIEWTSGIVKSANCIIYNKGSKLDYCQCPVFPVPLLELDRKNSMNEFIIF
jgi:hypothetical protein